MAYPEESTQYHKWEQKKEERALLATDLAKLQTLLHSAAGALDCSLGIWERSGNRSFWHFMFGRNPYTLISRQMNELDAHSTQALNLLTTQVPHNRITPELQMLLNELKIHLQRLQNHSQDSWHYHRFTTIYPADLDRLKMLISKLEDHQNQLQQRLEDLKPGLRPILR